jgi:hypothetical protein
MATETLVAGLGLKAGMAAAVLDGPPGWLAESPEGMRRVEAEADWGLLFARDVAALQVGWPRLRAAVKPGGLTWVAYPKRSGPIRTDLSRDVGWAVVAAEDWHAVAQRALDATWSALRFRPRAEIKKMVRRF